MMTWQDFKVKCLGFVPEAKEEPTVESKPPKVEINRAWRNTLLSDEQRLDLEDTVNTPGYEALQDLMENTLEGFVTHLIETDPADEKKVLAAQKLVHAGYLFKKSIETQVGVYLALNRADVEEASEMERLLNPENNVPNLDNLETLSKLLDPTHVSKPKAQDTTKPPVRQRPTTPLDEMLKQG